MNDFLTFLLGFIVVAVAITIGFGALQTVHSVNYGNCNQAENGTWENCTLSNADANQLQKSEIAVSAIFGQLSYVQWILIAGTLITVVFFFTKRRT